MSDVGPSRRQTFLLTRLFVARFFENDLSGGSGDLKSSFFWLLAFLAPIGILMPWSRSLQYSCYYLVGGVETVSVLALEDKAFYVGLGMVATGVVGIMAWPSFLLDRRDVLVLGALPVSGTVIVRAKLLGVLAYGALLAAGMHAGGSVTFGLLLTDGRPFSFVFRAVVAHFLASSLASMFVLLLIVASQAVLAAVTSGRVFARISPLLQIVTAVGVLGMLIALPSISSALVYADERWGLATTGRAVRACAPGMRQQLGVALSSVRPWADLTPVAWFAGLYEWLLGTGSVSVNTLATTAGVGSLVVAAAAVFAYPTAARRMMRAAVEGTGGTTGRSLGTHATAWAVRVLVRTPARRAAVQFFSGTALRVSTHRFVLALGIGATIALLLPAAISGMKGGRPSPLPSVALLSLPLTVMIGVLVAVRLAASLPAELGAAWMFRVAGWRKRQARSALWRTMWTIGVAVPVVVFTPVYWTYWGASLAVSHAVLCAALGALLTEGLLWRFAGMPCTTPWQPSDANLRTWWPAYIAAFLVITQGTPRLSLLLEGSTVGVSVAVLALLVAGWLLHRAGTRGIEAVDADDLLAPQVLHLQ